MFVKWKGFLSETCTVKWVIFFASFCWLWDFLPENLKLVKLHIWGFNNLFAAPNFIFGTFLSIVLKFFNHSGQHFTQPTLPLTIKKLHIAL